MAIDRTTRSILAYKIGSRGKKKLKRLLTKIKHISCKKYTIDIWKAYHPVISKDKLVQSKKKLFTLNLKIVKLDIT